MPPMPAARLSDFHICPFITPVVPPIPHVGGPIVTGCFTVLIGGLPAARMTDMCICVGPPDLIVSGEFTVLIGGLPAARMLDMTAHCGMILLGCFTVLIPGFGGGGASGGAAGAGAGAAAKPANGPFKTADEAAKAALTAANPQSIKDNLEYSGLIYQDKDGNFYYTGPAKGTDQGANPKDAPAPPGTKVVGDYHTHGDYSTADPKTGKAVRTSDPKKDDFNSDNFSTTDKTGIASDGKGTPGYAGYLGTPSGTFRKYDPATGKDTKL